MPSFKFYHNYKFAYFKYGNLRIIPPHTWRVFVLQVFSMLSQGSVRKKRPAVTRAYPDQSASKQPRRIRHASSEVDVGAAASLDGKHSLGPSDL